MLAHPTLDHLHALGLHGLAKGFKELEHKAEVRSLDHAEWLGLLLEYELTLRRQKQFETRARVARLLRSLARVKLLILDDWGPEALTPNQARDLLEIVEDRYDKGSLIITSQVPVDRWHDLIGVPTLADAILDRVIHNAYRIELAGESLRKRPPSA